MRSNSLSDCRRDRLDVDVEQVDHPQVFRPRDALDRADDRRRLGAAQDVAQRQAAGHGVGVRIVVQQDQHAIGVAEVALVLLDARARQRPAELGEQRRRRTAPTSRDTTTSGNSAWNSSARLLVAAAPMPST